MHPCLSGHVFFPRFNDARIVLDSRQLGIQKHYYMEREKDIRMQFFAIFGALFSTFGVNLDLLVSRFAQIDMNLTVFTINLLLAAHLTPAYHAHAVLDTMSLVPGLSCNLATKFDQVLWPGSQASVP